MTLTSFRTVKSNAGTRKANYLKIGTDVQVKSGAVYTVRRATPSGFRSRKERRAGVESRTQPDQDGAKINGHASSNKMSGRVALVFFRPQPPHVRGPR